MNEQNFIPENIPISSPLPDAADPVYAPAKPIEPRFSLADTIAAWCCFALGFIFTRFVADNPCGIWGGVFWALVGVLTAVYARVKKLPVTRAHIAVFAVAELFCFVPLFSANYLVNFLAACFSFALMFYLSAAVSGAELFGKRFVGDLLKSLLIKPFSEFIAAPRAASSVFKNRKHTKNLLYAAAGLICALPLTIIVVSLLKSSDGAFEQLIDKMLGCLPELSFGLIWQIIFALPIGMYVFGMLFSANSKAEAPAESGCSLRLLPATLVYAAVTPVCLFYLVYILSQLGYLTAAFGGTLPAGYSYSEFARRGFFELCVVAVINLCVIAVMQAFTRRGENDIRPRALRVYTVVISVFTLLLIASALSKMFLYIGEMGMTPLRIYTSWFMLVLTAAFVLIILLQFKEIPFWRVMAAAFTVMFALLCFGNVDGMIARYNVNAFYDGRHSSVDFGVLRELGVSAVKPLAVLCEDENPHHHYEAGMAQETIRLISEDAPDGFGYFSIPWAQAQAVMEQYSFD